MRCETWPTRTTGQSTGANGVCRPEATDAGDGNDYSPLPVDESLAADDKHADPEEPLPKVVGVARIVPEAVLLCWARRSRVNRISSVACVVSHLVDRQTYA